MDIQLHSYTNPNQDLLFDFDYAFDGTWILVTDSNNRDVQVMEEDIIPCSNMPNASPDEYVKVFYCGKAFWLERRFHYPM